MQERQVTSEDGTRALERPFLVLATQNPIEYEGTYPLPEAQLDRFLLRIRVGYPDRARRARAGSRGAWSAASDEVELRTVVDRDELLAMQRAVEQVHADAGRDRLRRRPRDRDARERPGAGGRQPTRHAGAAQAGAGEGRAGRARLRHARRRQADRGAGAGAPDHAAPRAVDPARRRRGRRCATASTAAPPRPFARLRLGADDARRRRRACRPTRRSPRSASSRRSPRAGPELAALATPFVLLVAVVLRWPRTARARRRPAARARASRSRESRWARPHGRSTAAPRRAWSSTCRRRRGCRPSPMATRSGCPPASSREVAFELAVGPLGRPRCRARAGPRPRPARRSRARGLSSVAACELRAYPSVRPPAQARRAAADPTGPGQPGCPANAARASSSPTCVRSCRATASGASTGARRRAAASRTSTCSIRSRAPTSCCSSTRSPRPSTRKQGTLDAAVVRGRGARLRLPRAPRPRRARELRRRRRAGSRRAPARAQLYRIVDALLASESRLSYSVDETSRTFRAACSRPGRSCSR